MQRHYEEIRDVFGNPTSGCLVEVFNTGTAVYAPIYLASSSSDSPSTVVSQPLTTGTDGRFSFAINDGDFDLKITYPDLSTWTRVRLNFFDSTTSTTIPVSSISLAMPSQMAVSGSPGTSITVTWNTQTANTVLAGPTTGGAATPTFRALVAADVNPVAVDLTTNQTAAGNKTWSGTATFSAAVTHSSTLNQTGASSFAADITLETNVDVVMNKTSHFYMASAGTSGWRTAWAIPENNTVVSGTLPTAATFVSTLRGWNYSASATNERIYYLTIPNDYTEGTDIYPIVVWTTNGTNTGNVKWSIEYTMIKGYNQGVLPSSTTVTITPAASGTVNQLMTSEFSAITGTSLEADALLVMRVFRDGSNGSDTCSDVAFLFAVGIHYSASRFSTINKAPNFYT